MSVARVTRPLVYELDEAAVKLGKSERWLADKLRGGQFPGRKIGRTWKLAPDDLDEIVRLCAVALESAPPTDATNSVVPQSSSMTRTTARRLRRGDQ
jgi:hypothetical protein